MNFFEAQARARKASRRLVLLFAIAVLAIVAVIDAIVLAALGVARRGDDVERAVGAMSMDAVVGVVVVTSLITLAVIGIASLVRIGSLRAGGSAVARSMGGTLVNADTTDLKLRRLRNVVEEIAIASGTPMPEVYVLDQEAGINAFAAGYSANDAVIAVTRGALERLNRDELQGVIAHEFSHVLNGDMRLNIRLMGLLFGILVLGIVGRKVLEHSRGGRDSRNMGVILLVALGIMLVGYIGVFFGRMIKAGVSRSREYLADASAVQFTRQTAGIAGALKKIGGLPAGSRLVAADTEEVSHMLFGDGIGFSSMFATHPPLLDRIRALDRSFRPEQLGALAKRWAQHVPSAAEEDLALGFAPDGSRLASDPLLPDGRASVVVDPQRVAAQVGTPAADDYRRASAIGAAMPQALHDAAQRQDQAMAVVLALLIDGDAAIAARQLAEVATRIDEDTADTVSRWRPATQALHPMLRLPLASLAFPALRRRPRPELERFLACVDVLIHLDGTIGLFEYCLASLLRRQTVEALDPSRHAPTGRRKLVELQTELSALFSIVAKHGHDDAVAAQRAFIVGLAQVLPHDTLRYAPPADWAAALGAALPRLDALEPRGKELLVAGLVAAISQDGRVSLAEAELLRMICAALHCPLPPMLER
ncbi:M48 family metallopeptidase [Chiayiivirga flava]|uniref:Zn-dependent protease with chaperone function n=1 Tax=Chiayiivirga flava TaxID=659595 RepID=A0A7W8D6J0_9GAMM|nr:M48 family metalloprotease [Chiayiivirga flava]MBB5208828.1 Zn-dependent protease with chaperone function [Chiayiivirga flava]